jgi:hypothetical protein
LKVAAALDLTLKDMGGCIKLSKKYANTALNNKLKINKQKNLDGV